MKIRALVAIAIGASLVALTSSVYAMRYRLDAKAAVADVERLIEETNHPLYERVVRADAGLPLEGALSPAAADAAVRDYVHRTNVVGTSPLISGRQVYAGLGVNPHLCGGMSWAHSWAMNQLGIPARYVELGGAKFLSGEDRYQTHAVSEVFYDGKWRISDPTFNVQLDCSDGERHLSVSEAFACLDRGEQLVGVPGKTTDTGRTLADFDYPYEQYYAAYERRATEDEPQEAWPEDGWIKKALAHY